MAQIHPEPFSDLAGNRFVFPLIESGKPALQTKPMPHPLSEAIKKRLAPLQTVDSLKRGNPSLSGYLWHFLQLLRSLYGAQNSLGSVLLISLSCDPYPTHPRRAEILYTGTLTATDRTSCAIPDNSRRQEAISFSVIVFGIRYRSAVYLLPSF